jgi:hypothetical protein
VNGYPPSSPPHRLTNFYKIKKNIIFAKKIDMKKFNESAWRAENDASVMAQYEEIMNDSKRRNAAIRAARKQVDELNKRAASMERVYARGGRLTNKKK